MSMRSLKNFIFYNNTIPIAFGILFLGAGATFAASPEARQAIVSSETGLTSVDNSYLLNTTITDSTVVISIGSVREDDDTYYVEYQLTTLGIIDGTWQPTTETRTLTVPKDRIVGVDLGLYVADELSEVHAFEKQRLREFQDGERKQGVTPKVVATEYSGLIGSFFEPQAEVFPRYQPTINPEVGVPLSNQEERAHEAVRRLIEEEQSNRERQEQSPSQANNRREQLPDQIIQNPIDLDPDPDLQPELNPEPIIETDPGPPPSAPEPEPPFEIEFTSEPEPELQSPAFDTAGDSP